MQDAHFPRSKEGEEGSGIEPVWIVGTGESESYTAAGARQTLEGGSLCASRNLALDTATAQGKLCVELSDDIRKFRFHEADEWGPVGGGQKGAYRKCSSDRDGNGRASRAVRFDLTAYQAACLLEAAMRKSGAKLGGAHPTGAISTPFQPHLNPI